GIRVGVAAEHISAVRGELESAEAAEAELRPLLLGDDIWRAQLGEARQRFRQEDGQQESKSACHNTNFLWLGYKFHARASLRSPVRRSGTQHLCGTLTGIVPS